jgi:hypothetical protein
MDASEFFVIDAHSGVVVEGRIARDIGLLNDHGEFLCLLEAGTKTPVVTEFTIHAASRNQGFAAVALYSRVSPSGLVEPLAEVRVSELTPTSQFEGAFTAALYAHDRALVFRATASEGAPLAVHWARPQ